MKEIRIYSKETGLLKFGMDWGVHHFPDGQVQVWIKKDKSNSFKFSVEACINSPLVYHFLQQINRLLLNPRLRCIYLYGARSDKKEAGDTSVVNVSEMTYIDLLHFYRWDSTARVFHPHSLFYDENFIEYEWCPLPDLTEYDTIIYPDKSAEERGHVGKTHCQELHCEKERDQVTGLITKFRVVEPNPQIKKALVVDDICDGGATFNLLADSLPGVKMDLFVPHGIFSQGLEKLLKRYEKIYTTDSYIPSNFSGEKISERIFAEKNGRLIVTKIWDHYEE